MKKPTADQIEQAKEVLKNAGYLSPIWRKDDVFYLAKDMKKKLSKKETDIISATIEHCHDAQQGINWDVIRCHINMYIDDKKAKAKEKKKK